MNKKFTSSSIPDVFYEVLDEKWIDEDTYVIVFQDMLDVDGDEYHLEVEYHKDEDEIFFIRVYEHDTLIGREYVSPCFVKQIEEYILKQVGKLDKDSMFTKHTINVELTLGIPLDMSVGEFQDWLKNDLKVSVMTSIDSKVNILKVNKK